MVVDVMRRLIKRRLPELAVAGVTGQPQVPHAQAALCCFPCRRAEAGFPPDLCQAGPQLVAERTALRLVIEHGSGHDMIMPGLTIFIRT